MPSPSLNPSMNRQTRTVIRDSKGNVILEIGLSEAMIFNPDGTMTKQRISENIVLACGAVFNPAMAMGQDPVMLIGVCDRCHRLCSKEGGHRCDECDAFLCPSDARKADNGGWRCASCACKAAWKSRICTLARWAFTKEA